MEGELLWPLLIMSTIARLCEWMRIDSFYLSWPHIKAAMTTGSISKMAEEGRNRSCIFWQNSGCHAEEKKQFYPLQLTWKGIKPWNCQEERESNIGLCGVGQTVWGCCCNQKLAWLLNSRHPFTWLQTSTRSQGELAGPGKREMAWFTLENLREKFSLGMRPFMLGI